uniref:Uncharacterized protein n=1 Tax=Anguilla anguilla TaxID=7936 RepID=A0A0E9S4X2_ANGAN
MFTYIIGKLVKNMAYTERQCFDVFSKSAFVGNTSFSHAGLERTRGVPICGSVQTYAVLCN